MNKHELNLLLNEHACPAYGIEYKSYLSNHLAHGIIALYKLGATKARTQEFIDWYLPKLEKPETQPDQSKQPEKPAATIEELQGLRLSYFPILNHYRDVFETKFNGSISDFVAHYYPKLAAGMGSALLHVGIHTGYGCSVDNEKLVLEGIAYFHHSYAPIQLSESNAFPFGNGNMPILQVLQEVKNDKALIEYMIRESSRPDWMAYYRGNAQKRVNLLAKDKGDELSVYVSKIQLPKDLNVKIDNGASLEDVLLLAEWVIDCSIIVFLCSEKKNDFFFLHGVTGAWSLKEVLLKFKPSQSEEAIHCIKLYLIVLFSVYLTQDVPVLNEDYLKDSSVANKTWEEIINKAIDLVTDEHVYKLVQVCHERSLKGPKENEDIYKAAAMLSMSKPFF